MTYKIVYNNYYQFKISKITWGRAAVCQHTERERAMGSRARGCKRGASHQASVLVARDRGEGADDVTAPLALVQAAGTVLARRNLAPKSRPIGVRRYLARNWPAP